MRKRGFTIVELLGVILLLSIVTGGVVVGYITITENIRKAYYKGIEESILLAGGEYYSYNREKEPVAFGNVEEVELNELISGQYIEKVLDKNKKECDYTNSIVTAYKDSYDKVKYGVCLVCPEDNYKSSIGCDKEYNLKLKMTKGDTKVKYKNGTWSNEDVYFYFETANDITRVEIVGENGEAKTCNLVKNNNKNSCKIKVEASGTYTYTGYGENGNKTEEKSVSVLIDKSKPTYVIEERGTNNIITINTSEMVEITNKVKNIQDTGSGIEYVRYSLEKEGQSEKYKTVELEEEEYIISKNLTKGRWTLKIEAKDKAGNKTVEEITYIINKDIYEITLNSGGAKTKGTETIYEKYEVGWYENREGTTSISKITIPEETGSLFEGYYTGENGSGTQIINATGTIIGSNKSFTKETVLYAKWTGCTYIVKYDKNGATSGTTGDSSHVVGVAKNLTANGYTRAYKVTYNYNGADGGSATASNTPAYTFNGWATSSGGAKVYNNSQLVTDLTKTCNGTVTLYANWTSKSVTLPSPTKTGYTFQGWYSDSGLTSKVGNGGASYTPTKNITLYAKWSGCAYTVKYNGNGATSGTTGDSSHVVGVAKNLTANGYTRAYKVTYNYNGADGGNATANNTATYTYNGWATSSGGAKVYNNSQSVTKLTTTCNGTVTLYANWTSKSITLPSPTKTGYTFLGWYSDSGLTSKVGNGGASYTPTTNITLYAKWSGNSYTITLNKNGGTNNPTASVKATYGSSVLNPSSITLPERKYTVSGFGLASSRKSDSATVSSTTTLTSTYAFNGWYTTSTGGTKVLSNGASPTLQASITGYTNASKQWIKTGGATLYANWTSKSVTLPTISKQGYTCGWTTNSNGATITNTNGSGYTPTANITMYGVCVGCAYTVVYNGNGSTGGSTGNSSHIVGTAKNLTSNGYTRAYKVTYNYNGATGGNATASNTVAYTFNGWATSSGGAKVYNNSQSVTDLTKTCNGTVTLYANWTGGSVTLPSPTKTGYTFQGWYSDSGLTTKVGNGGASYTPTKAITLYAKWTPKIFTITLDNQSETTAGTKTIYEKYATGWYTNSTATKTLSSITVPTKKGSYTTAEFGGYYTAKNGEGTKIIRVDGTVRVANTYFSKDTTLYAYWKFTPVLTVSGVKDEDSKSDGYIRVRCKADDGVSEFLINGKNASVISSESTSTNKVAKVNLKSASGTVKISCTSKSKQTTTQTKKYSWSSDSDCGTYKEKSCSRKCVSNPSNYSGCSYSSSTNTSCPATCDVCTTTKKNKTCWH